MTRVRVRFSKIGKIRWTSHRDLARMWERAFRRAQLPLVYTSGFSPRPKVSFGLALPTGHESVAEYLDLELLELPDIAGLPARLSAVLPGGVDATAAALVDAHGPSLQEEVSSSTWRLVAVPAEGARPMTVEEMSQRVEALLSASEAVVTRLRKEVEVTDDIRPSIIGAHVVDPAGLSSPAGSAGVDLEAGITLVAELATKPRSIRPSELLLALESAVPGTSGRLLEERDVRRLHQWILRDGARTEPLAIGDPDAATDAPLAFGWAS